MCIVQRRGWRTAKPAEVRHLGSPLEGTLVTFCFMLCLLLGMLLLLLLLLRGSPVQILKRTKN